MGVIVSVMRWFFNDKPTKNEKDDECSVELEEIRIEDPKSSENVEGRENVKVIKINVVREEKWINDYSSLQKILIVGDGDFSFSASLATAFGNASNITATSLDSIDFLQKHYRRAISNIKDLKNRGGRVMHGVDATQMAHSSSFKNLKFDRVIYNFPHAGFFKTESRYSQIRIHQELVSLFLENAKEMINEDGEIHITHKTNSFHREWNIEYMGTSRGLKFKQAVPFKCEDYPGYRTKYGFGGDKDFDCNPSKTYKFGLSE